VLAEFPPTAKVSDAIPAPAAAPSSAGTATPPYPWYRLRHACYDAIYVSPHLDDAVYSCGGQIALQRASGQRVLIVTVFGHGESAEHGPGVFRDYTRRKREEQAAVERLDADHLWLNYADALVRTSSLADLVRYALPFISLDGALCRRIEVALYALVTRLLAPDGQLYVPLGVGAHPDHRLVFEAVRAMSSRARAWREQFYEDVPYAQVPAVRADRLHYLGLSRQGSLASALRAVRETRAFWFAHAPAWQQPILSLLVGAHWGLSRALFFLFGRRDALADQRALSELAIDSVIDDKVAAMRAYATQTAYFFPAGDAIYGALVRSRGHYVERYWKLREPTAHTHVKAQPDLPLEQELARVDRLLAELAG
jgi:LmbE family N-acetylglucosaminyl deacetylase